MPRFISAGLAIALVIIGGVLIIFGLVFQPSDLQTPADKLIFQAVLTVGGAFVILLGFVLASLLLMMDHYSGQR